MNYRYKTAWVDNAAGEGRITITRFQEPSNLIHSSDDRLLERAIADDLHHNDGWMFGHETLKFYTALMTYPEFWSIARDGIGWCILQRTPTHPHQTVRFYRYTPSRHYGGNAGHDCPKFELITGEPS
tara:strand:+ start:2287 stop:2667 length:381 start_codon:yes stop_codon:yes gene_type:complete